MPLPSDLTDQIFGRLAVRYGSLWTAKWAGLEVAAVKADWARELAGFERNPTAIRYALANLPLDFPPTVAQFKALCADRPEPAPLALPAPKSDPARVRKELERLAELRNRTAARPLEWAYRLQEQESQGVPLRPAQKEAWRAALRTAVDDRALFRGGCFNPVPADCLPPGMRPDSAPQIPVEAYDNEARA